MGIFLDLVAKARKDPLGPSYLSGLSGNVGYVRKLQGVEHLASGEHNVHRVPRAVVSIIWSGSAYSISPSSADVTAVANPAVGTVTLTLATGRFTANLRPQLNFKGSTVSTKPWVLGYNVVSATSIQIFLQQLTSALGTSNVWAPTDGSFDIALHSDALNQGLYGALPAGHFRGDKLTDQATDWNALVQAQGDMQQAFGAGHDKTSGAHAVREVAKAYAHVQFGSGAYAMVSGAGHSSNILAAVRTSAGICVLQYASSLTLPSQCFVAPDYPRASGGGPGIFIMQAEQTSLTKSTVYIYQLVPNISVPGTYKWVAADSDFFAAVHSG